MRRIYNILSYLFGESKQGSYDESVKQYQFNCPSCADEKGYVDNKYNLEVSLLLGKYHCWACGISGNLSSLIRQYGGGEVYKNYYTIINDLKESKYYDINLFKDTMSDVNHETILHLPKTFKKIDLSSKYINKELSAYLQKRKISQDIIDEFNIGVTQWDNEIPSWRNRIIFPSYDINGNLNYFIGRTYKKNDLRIKYKNCDANKNQIILHEDKIQWDADIYLVEGTIDCIYLPNCIPLLGKTLSTNTEIYEKISKKANANIIICLDGDTDINETKRIYALLDKGRLSGKIKYIRLGDKEIQYKDFGEIYENEEKNGIIKAIKTAKRFSTIEMTIDYNIKNQNKNKFKR